MRNALRKALRAHPDIDGVLHDIPGVTVGTATMAQLQTMARVLGIDVDGVIRAGALVTKERDMDMPDENETTDQNETAPITETSGTSLDTVIETEMRALRTLISDHGFSALDARLRDLIRDAHKPAEIVEIPVPAATSGGVMPITVSRCTGQEKTWRELFGVPGALGKRTTKLWDGTHPDTPKVNTKYVFPPATGLTLTQIARGRNVYLYGPAGTGKTEFARQLAAKTGRPCAIISCDNTTDGPTLVGMTVPSSDGGVAWQDGQLTMAIQTPGCVVCLDEPSVARPGALFVLQNVLANRELYIAETGRRVRVADGVIFLATDNTNGTGGGGRKGYTDTNRLNAAFLDRFGVRVKFDYMSEDQERDIIVAYTKCPPALAELLIKCASVTRAAANDQTLTHGIGLRRLLSWAEALIDGNDAEEAFCTAVLNCAPEQDVETLRQQCILAYDKSEVAKALNPSTTASDDPTHTNPTVAGRAAAREFS
jgi:MoxR-like ATPase